MKGFRGQTFLEDDILATYPRDETRGVVLRRELTPSAHSALTFLAGVDPGRVWNLDVYINNDMVYQKLIQGQHDLTERSWEKVRVDLSPYAGQQIQIRLFQRVLIDGKMAGNAYWKELQILTDTAK
jgi:hypothetical protein